MLRLGTNLTIGWRLQNFYNAILSLGFLWKNIKFQNVFSGLVFVSKTLRNATLSPQYFLCSQKYKGNTYVIQVRYNDIFKKEWKLAFSSAKELFVYFCIHSHRSLQYSHVLFHTFSLSWTIRTTVFSNHRQFNWKTMKSISVNNSDSENNPITKI